MTQTHINVTPRSTCTVIVGRGGECSPTCFSKSALRPHVVVYQLQETVDQWQRKIRPHTPNAYLKSEPSDTISRQSTQCTIMVCTIPFPGLLKEHQHHTTMHSHQVSIWFNGLLFNLSAAFSFSWMHTTSRKHNWQVLHLAYSTEP